MGVSMFEAPDAEFAMVIYDADRKQYIAARDPIGIRPLYFGRDGEGAVVIASEPKNLVGVCGQIMPVRRHGQRCQKTVRRPVPPRGHTYGVR